MKERHDHSSGSPAPASGFVDLLSDVLRTVRLTGSMFFLVETSPPWVSMAPAAASFQSFVLPRSQHLISYHVVVDGRCWGGLAGAPLVHLEAGDILVIPHGHAYLLADSPETPARGGGAETVEFFRQMAAGHLPSVVVEGSGGVTRTRFICGFLGCDLRPFNPALAALPPMIRLNGATGATPGMSHLVQFALSELRERQSGSDVVLLRLSELMFVEVVRCHLQACACDPAQTGWLAGLRDPLVGRVLERLHGAPSRPWTLDLLASEVGVSRSVLADRFMQLVGQPPMHYLTQWRMQLASRLLADGAAKLRSVADAVGYESEAAFSRAFKRSAGTAPSQWRRSLGTL